MKKLKRILSLVMTIFLMCNLYTPVFATENNGTEPNNEEFSINLYGEELKKYEDIAAYNEGNLSDIYSNVDSADLLITYSNNEVELTISDDASSIQQFRGMLYALNGNGYYDERIILGKFESSNALVSNIILFKIFKENNRKNMLDVIVEDFETAELTEYSYVVTNENFQQLMCIAQKATSLLENSFEEQKELSAAKEILGYMQPVKWCMAAKNTQSVIYAQSNKSFKSTTSYSGAAIVSSTLKSFCQKLENYPNSSISADVYTLRDVFSQTGWKMYKTDNFFYVMHGVANSSTEQLVGITAASVSNKKVDNKLSASFTVIASCTALYDKNTQKATLLMANSGIRLEKAKIAIELVGGTTNFDEATKTYTLQNQNSVKNILVAISSKLGAASAIWDALTTTTTSSDNVDFGTDDNQKSVYDGLVRAIANEAKTSAYLWGVDTSLGIKGYYFADKTYSSHRIAYSFTGYSLL